MSKQPGYSGPFGSLGETRGNHPDLSDEGTCDYCRSRKRAKNDWLCPQCREEREERTRQIADELD